MRPPRRRNALALAGDVAVAVLVIASVATAVQIGEPAADANGLHAGDVAVYRVFWAHLADGMLVPEGTASSLQVSTHSVKGRPGDLAIRFSGPAAGVGESTVFVHQGQPTAWSSVVHADGLRDERVLVPPAYVIPHCIAAALLLADTPCGVEPTPTPGAWFVDPAWTLGAPHGLADGVVERRDDTTWPLMLAAGEGDGWLVLERLNLRRVEFAPVPWPIVGPVSQVDMRPATPWLFSDRDPAPRLGLPLGNTFQRAQGNDAWGSFWDRHPNATVVDIKAPRANVLDGDPMLTWTLLVQDKGAWEIELSDQATLRTPPGLLRPAADGLWDHLPQPTPQVRIKAHPGTPGSAPAHMPDLGQASLAWTRAFSLPDDIRYTFYERQAANGTGLSFVGGWSAEPGGDLVIKTVGGILIDDEGRVLGSSKRISDTTTSPQPAVPEQSAASIPMPRMPAPVAWWTGLSVGLWLLRTPLALLFSKIRPDALENPTRKAIVDIVARRPGIALAELAREIAAPHARVQYHLRILRVLHKVDVIACAGRTMLVPWGLDTAQRQRLLAQPTPAQASLLEALAATPQSTAASLAHVLRVNQTLVARQLRHLAAQGRVVRGPGRPAKWSTVARD